MTAHLPRSAEAHALRREMGCTREDFLRWLPGAARHAPMQLNTDTALVQAGEATVEISFIEAPPRTVALVCLPVLVVSFRFSGADTVAYGEFMAYFDLYTNRGGG